MSESKAERKKRKRRILDLVKIARTVHYDHTLAKHMARKRYQKQTKPFAKKGERKREKERLNRGEE